MLNKLKEMFRILLKEFIPNRLARYKIFIQRPRLLIWLLVSFATFCSGFEKLGTVIPIILYLIVVNVALSDFAEKIFRKLEDVRRIATKTEKERLIPLFKNVYEQSKAKSKYISRELKLYIIDDISVNAFALGRNTIAVTRGLMENMNDEEIEAIIAHEFGHMANGDAQLSMIISIGTTMYLWFFLLLKGVLRAIEGTQSENTSMSGILSIIRFVIELAIKIVIFIWSAIIASGSRKKEYRADMFAKDLGYGEQLLSALYKLYDMEISDKKNLVEQIKSSHPKIAYRIEVLENCSIDSN